MISTGWIVVVFNEGLIPAKTPEATDAAKAVSHPRTGTLTG
jgi:hypothetical protein